MKIPERSPDCARYDSTLIYTYKPNGAYLQNQFEFQDSIRANKGRFRDDDSSLVAPDIICLGDSYTMGWGVNQQDAFPQLIETETGLKVLNAGISSYGTARETLLYKRLDTSNLKFIILQYCWNDIGENNSYIQNNFSLPVPTFKHYDSLVVYHKWNTVYFPFKRSLMLMRIAGKDLFRRLRHPNYLPAQWKMYYDTSYVPDAAKAFLDILSKSTINFKKVKVLVVDVNRYPEFDHHFLEKAQSIISQPGLSEEFRQSVKFVLSPSLNNRKCYYALDNHLTPYGHKVLAKAIADAIAKNSY